MFECDDGLRVWFRGWYLVEMVLCVGFFVVVVWCFGFAVLFVLYWSCLDLLIWRLGFGVLW